MDKICKLCAITLCLFCLSGCWDSTDIQLEDIHITEVIDYQDGNYHFYGEVANSSGQSQSSSDGAKSGKQNFSIIKASGTTFTEARDDLERKSGNPIYLGACKVLIFTDRLSSLGVEEYLNRSRTQHSTRKSLRIITTADEPEEFLDVQPDNSASIGLSVDNILENTMKNGFSFNVDIGDLLEALAVKKVGFLIPSMSVQDSKITLTGYTVFKNAKKVGFIPAQDRKGVVFFLNPGGHFNYEVQKDAEKFQMEVNLKGKKIKTSYQDGQLDIHIQMDFTAALNYMDKTKPVTDSDIEQLQDLLAETVKQDILTAMEMSQKEYGSDYLEIYRYFRAYHNSIFKTIDWEQAYSGANVDVETSVAVTLSDLPIEQ